MHSSGYNRAHQSSVLSDQKRSGILLRLSHAASFLNAAAASNILRKSSPNRANLLGLSDESTRSHASSRASPAERSARRPYQRLLRHVRGPQRHDDLVLARGARWRRAQGHTRRNRRRTTSTTIGCSSARRAHHRSHVQFSNRPTQSDQPGRETRLRLQMEDARVQLAQKLCNTFSKAYLHGIKILP